MVANNKILKHILLNLDVSLCISVAVLHLYSIYLETQEFKAHGVLVRLECLFVKQYKLEELDGSVWVFRISRF